MNETYISHSGIKGMRWGVRRYQNEDGTLTEAGKERYGKGDGEKVSRKELTSDQKKKIAAIALGVAAAGTVAYMVSTKDGRKVLTKAGEVIKEKAQSPELKEFVKKAGQTTMAKAKESTKRFGKRVAKKARASVDRVEDAIIDAALVSVGTVVMSSIANKLTSYGEASDLSPSAKKIISSSINAGQKAVISSTSASTTIAAQRSQISSAVGSPTHKTIDKQSAAYRNLFTKQNGEARDSSDREIIRAMSNAGYDINQIETYIKKRDSGEIAHSDIPTYFVVRIK